MAVIRTPAKDHATGVRPWLGMTVSPVAWIGAQQGMGDLDRLACPVAGPPLGPLIGLAAVAICLLCGWLSWTAVGSGRGLKRFVGLTSAGAAAVFAAGGLLVTLASLVIPPCAH